MNADRRACDRKADREAPRQVLEQRPISRDHEAHQQEGAANRRHCGSRKRGPSHRGIHHSTNGEVLDSPG